MAAEILTDFPERLAEMGEVWLAGEQVTARRTTIASCRIHLGQAIIHFDGINTISDAEVLRGLEVQVPLEERVRLGPGRYYINELVGCRVLEEGSTDPLGMVREVERAGEENRGGLPESWNLVVDTPNGELLIPLAAEICIRIDTAARRIDVRLPAGLRELNAT